MGIDESCPVTTADLLVEAFARIHQVVHTTVKGLTQEELGFRIDREANSICWLVWHLTRVQDDHLAGAANIEQVWTSQSWVERFGLPFASLVTGYQHTADEVAAVQVAGDLLIGYHDAVYARSVSYVAGLTDQDFARIVDEYRDPPMSLGVRLISVLSDNFLHAGQAAFLHGVVQRLKAERRCA
jgi:hypothetical protein